MIRPAFKVLLAYNSPPPQPHRHCHAFECTAQVCACVCVCPLTPSVFLENMTCQCFIPPVHLKIKQCNKSCTGQVVRLVSIPKGRKTHQRCFRLPALLSMKMCRCTKACKKIASLYSLVGIGTYLHIRRTEGSRRV